MELFNTFVSERSKELVQEVLDSTFLNQGKYVDLFELRLCNELYMTNPVTLNSCTSSLHLALILSGVKAGDEVILPPQTFIATGLAVLMVGAIPVFADVDKNGNISAMSVQEKISSKTKAVIAVHWGGIPTHMLPLAMLCRQMNIKLIEDAAHAIGAQYVNSFIGDCQYSNFCCFSLQSIKNLTTGDGGILCCKSLDDYNRAIKLRWFGMDKKSVQRGPTGERLSEVKELGYKYHMNDVSAAIGLGNLDSLKSRINISRSYADLYYERLKHLNLGFPIVEDRMKPSYWFYPLRSTARDFLVKKLNEKGIPASTIDRRVDNHPVFKKYQTSLVGQDAYDSRQFALPCHSQLTIDNVIYIIDSIKEILGVS